MHIALDIIGGFFGLIAVGSAFGKLTKNAQVMESMAHVKVPTSLVPVLALLEIAGAAGIVAGIWSKPLGVAAALGLAVYFLGAVLAHLRVKDALKNALPPIVLTVIAVAVLVLELQR